ncbi:regulatory protein E2 [Leopardus wiedii papillomavirus type 1]|uniref:Regulatory protein E2 n=1 Tax=Leopardus wiedii papillomavirus type 1 TaxID=2495531 RepID=A0A3S8V2Q8_9PAPI|nr:regulatory protein E2 [Leopardus wiedii papillomavirus type 1]
MENLSKALEQVQEELLSLYEKDSKQLRDQIKHWQLSRRENGLLYVAKKKGVMRLGMTPVPSLAASQQRAKDAIEQGLLLQSLALSPYSTEEWTLADTSRERLLAAPVYCFKKNGTQVDVRFDGDEDNVSRYVLWEWIYFQNNDEQWVKAEGKLDMHGLYYLDDLGGKNYYVDFRDEAEKYSKTGTYDVLTVLTPPAVSTSTTTQAAGRGESPSTSFSTSATSPWEKSTPQRRRRLDPAVRGRRGRRGGRRRLVTPDSKPRTQPPSPEDVGRSTETVPTGTKGRLNRLLLEAADPPVLVLTGDPNSLKCLRYRLRSNYSSFFSTVSTTFKWTCSSGTSASGAARMMLAFTTCEQRQSFLNCVPLPKSVHGFLGSLTNL